MNKLVIASFALLFSASALADISVPMHLTAKTGEGKMIGAVDIVKTKYGVMFRPHLSGLTPGVHGFHVHVKPDCSNEGLAANGHYDPKGAEQHLGPYHKGHLGDLPVLVVNRKGNANTPVIAPRLKMDELPGHALMIHAYGDNYSDKPKENGGGGLRVACGVIPKTK